VTGWHRHRHRPGPELPVDTASEGRGLLLATSGDLDLTTHGDFLMATDRFGRVIENHRALRAGMGWPRPARRRSRRQRRRRRGRFLRSSAWLLPGRLGAVGGSAHRRAAWQPCGASPTGPSPPLLSAGWSSAGGRGKRHMTSWCAPRRPGPSPNCRGVSPGAGRDGQQGQLHHRAPPSTATGALDLPLCWKV